MEKRKILKVLCWNFLCLLLFSSLAFGYTVTVSVPDTTGSPGETIRIPILAEDMPPDTVWSADIIISYNPAIVQAESVIFSGTLVDGWSNHFNIFNDSIIFALAGSHTISGSGALVYVRFKVLSSALPGDTAVIHFKKMRFNEGDPSASVEDGVLRVIPTAVYEDDDLNLPSGFSLGQNYPNPFNPATTIPFQVEGGQWSVGSPIHATLTIYNILGQRVRALVDEKLLPGGYQVIWDSKDDREKEVPSGVYFYQLKSGNTSETRKMVLMR